MPSTPSPRRAWFLAGLFLCTLAPLSLEILDTRLLSVMTWYHLSFFAVSVAMFGMAAGALRVYLAGSAFQGDAAPRQLARQAAFLAVAIPVSHALNLSIPMAVDASASFFVSSVLTTIVLAIPFYFAGIVVAVALTRIPEPVGVTYAVDLVGASVGCLVCLPLLEATSLPSTVIAVGGIAALGAACFHRYAYGGGGGRMLALAGTLVGLAIANGATDRGLRVAYPKGRFLQVEDVAFEGWNIHSQVVALQPTTGAPQYWGPGKGAGATKVESMAMAIDGEAGTRMTRWDGKAESLDWVRFDVTSLPYHLRKGQKVGIVGVGGGRDVLTALWSESPSVTGVEINGNFLYLLQHHLRDFSRVATDPRVTLVHDEARSWLSRGDPQFGILQMSLIDTWAATGAGAFTLSENGLYTMEAWRVFLAAVEPGGLFSVSRWFSPEEPAETGRLLALGTAALLDRGIDNPRDHLALVGSDRCATMLASPQPLTPEDLAGIDRVAAEYGYTVFVAPGRESSVPILARILASTSIADLVARVADEPLDFSPPTDNRPFFFNMVKLPRLVEVAMQSGKGVVASGNLGATYTLAMLGVVSASLVGLVIALPLVRSGRPKMEPVAFRAALSWFAQIGFGFMMVQIPFMQRFSVYLGHPTYAVAVILFSMILAAGIGSALSERVPTTRAAIVAVPALITTLILLASVVAQPVIDQTIRFGLLERSFVVVAFTLPVAMPLGLCFPLGMRLVGRLSPDATAWMWGINGATGVLAGVVAVSLSMWAGGTLTPLYVAAVLYGALVIPGLALVRAKPI